MTIKNGDLPAMPIELSGFGQFAPESHTGMTKHEQFAMAAMQGLLSKYGVYSDVATDSKQCADALLAELEKQK